MATMPLWKEAKHLPFYKLCKGKLGIYVVVQMFLRNMLYSTTGAQSCHCWSNSSGVTSSGQNCQAVKQGLFTFHSHIWHVASVLPFYVFTYHNNNLRWLWRKLAYITTDLHCRINLVFLIYFPKLSCMVSVLIFLSTWFSAWFSLWGCLVRYVKLVLLLS